MPRRTWPSATRPSCASSSRPRSAGQGSRTSRSTSTPSSTRTPSRSAGPGAATTSSRSRLPPTTSAAGLYEYNLDFPGDALNPGCDYELWARRITEGTEPTVYAHVAQEPAHPDRLALQYWLYYPFNDWNNLHEGDWEMIQLVFPAGSAEEALERRAARGRLQPARGRRAGGVGRREARARRRHAPGRLPGGRLARELLLGRALPRPLGRDGRRLRRHDRAERGAASRGALDPERPGGGTGGLPLDRVRGPLGRAPAGLLQRPDRSEPEGAVDGADHLVRSLARPQLRGARGRLRRDGRDRLLLRGRRGGIELRAAARRQRRARRLRPRRCSPRWSSSC